MVSQVRNARVRKDTLWCTMQMVKEGAKDQAEASKWLGKAATQGRMDAQAALEKLE